MEGEEKENEKRLTKFIACETQLTVLVNTRVYKQQRPCVFLCSLAMHAHLMRKASVLYTWLDLKNMTDLTNLPEVST